MKKAMKVLMYLVCLVIAIVVVSEASVPSYFWNPWNITEKKKGFYEEPKDSLDVVFVGASTTFMAVNPGILWNEYGIPSFDFCTSALDMQCAQLYVKEAIKTQHPRVIAIDMSLLKHGDRALNNTARHWALDLIPFSLSKVKTIIDYSPQDEWMEYLLPLVAYHSNHAFNVQNLFMPKDGIYLGYSPVFECYGKEFSYLEKCEITETLELEFSTIKAFNEVIKDCNEAGVELVLFGVPANVTTVERKRLNEVIRIAQAEGIPYIDMNSKEWLESNSYNAAIHSYDEPKHANWYGAELITRSLGEFLFENTSVEDRRDDPQYDYWYEKAAEIQRYADLPTAQSLEQFLLATKNYQQPDVCAIIITTKESNPYLSDEAATLLMEMGAEESLKDHPGASYIQVLYDGECVYQELSDTDILYFDGRDLDLEGLDVTASSAGANSLQSNDISGVNKVVFDNAQFTGKEGINIYIYNYVEKSIVIYANFDTTNSDKRT